ncbi:MAG: SGNH/GDSL hydrolase family protein [Vicinamibacterales bacterium]
MTFRLESTESSSATQATLVVRGAVREPFEAPAGRVLVVLISPSRFRDAGGVASVSISDGSVTLDPLTLARRPGRWRPSFESWSDLQDDFGGFKALLNNSKRFQLGRCSAPGQYVGGRYDSVDGTDEPEALAKMGLLNLCSRLRSERMPGSGEPWLGAINELLLAQQDRTFALVRPDFYDSVATLSRKAVDGYRRSNPGNHRDRIEQVPGVERVNDMHSVKTRDKKANIQLTVAKVTYRGESALLVDADIDEEGTLLGHTFEVARNFLTKHHTHPIDVHESLRLRFPTVALGYRLEPLEPIGAVTARMIATRASAAPSAAPAVLLPKTDFRPSRIAVLGDSVPWGQGLLRPQKIHELVADAYLAIAPRPSTRVVAHSGALIGAGMASTGTACDGEVPKGRPTIFQQVDTHDPAEAGATDMVIINGGINDVDVRTILSPYTSTTTLVDKTALVCGDHLFSLLQAAMRKFPRARIVVLTYYPIVSALSRFGEAIQLLSAMGAPPPLAFVPSASASEFSWWDKILDNCRVFHDVSGQAVRRAVQAANAGPDGLRCAVADPGFTAEHAALAPQARLFGINCDFSPQDPVARQRRLACDRCEKDLLRREQCYRASAGHPNPQGSEAFAAAVVAAAASLLPPVMPGKRRGPRQPRVAPST